MVYLIVTDNVDVLNLSDLRFIEEILLETRYMKAPF